MDLEKKIETIDEKMIKEGATFGKLKILKIEKIGEDFESNNCICRCECGKIVTINKYYLLTGKVKDCGCSKEQFFIKIVCPVCNNVTKIPIKPDEISKETTLDNLSNGQVIKNTTYTIPTICSHCFTEKLEKENQEKIFSKSLEDKLSLFQDFLKQKCYIDYKLDKTKRTKRSSFISAYHSWLSSIGKNNMALNFKQINYFLLQKYNENYIKSNGNFYLKNISLISDENIKIETDKD